WDGRPVGLSPAQAAATAALPTVAAGAGARDGDNSSFAKEDLELHLALVLDRDEPRDVGRVHLVVGEPHVERSDDLDVAPVPAAFERYRDAARDAVEGEVTGRGRAHRLALLRHGLEVDRLGEHELG